MEERTVGFLRGLVAVSLLLVAAWLLYYYFSVNGPSSDTKVQGLLREYNANLTVSNCMQDYEGYMCNATAEINMPDKNVSAKIYARAQVLVVPEKNSLVIVKISPEAHRPNLFAVKVPDKLKSALSKITMIPADQMFCVERTDTMYKCYIPTNIAPMGKATLLYAPLFEIHLDENGDIKTIFVNV